ncbi:MAG: lamin tail domain-containing protein, partial [Planctomycetota bacterium]
MHRFLKSLLLSFSLVALLAGSTGAESQLVGDLNSDYTVDFKDIQTLAWQWLHSYCLFSDCIADLDKVDGVNAADFALLAKNWYAVEPHIAISEFMASNASDLPLEDGELLDGHGESSDWIEIYNPTDTTIILDGWYLTNNDAILTKWQFPDGLEIEPGEFLIVFASEKTQELYPHNYPYLDPAGYYHTNFNLDKDKDYLALVASDGKTIAHEYAPQFPQQLTDISYGLTQYTATLVPTGATASYYVPTSNDTHLGTDWTNVNFNDSLWDTGSTSIGFGLGSSGMVAYNDVIYDSGQYIASNVTTYCIGSGNPGPTSGPLLDLATGDNTGITVTLTESGGVSWNPGSSTGGSDCAVGTDAYNTFGGIADMTGVLTYGSAGWQVNLAFTGLDPATEYTFATSANRGNPSYTNRRAVYTLTGADTYANASTGGVDVLAENQVRFNTGFNDDAGYVARWTGITAADGSFTVRAEADPTSPPPDDLKAYSFDVFMLDGGFQGTNVEEDMLGVNSSLWTRIEFYLAEGQEYLFDTLTLRIRYEDGFVAHLNGQQVASRNAPSSLQWNSTADSNRPIQDSSVFEEINLNAFLRTLQSGKNVLAIHGLNDHEDNGKFLILPELVAARNRVIPEYFTKPTTGSLNIAGTIGIV